MRKRSWKSLKLNTNLQHLTFINLFQMKIKIKSLNSGNLALVQNTFILTQRSLGPKWICNENSKCLNHFYHKMKCDLAQMR